MPTRTVYCPTTNAVTQVGAFNNKTATNDKKQCSKFNQWRFPNIFDYLQLQTRRSFGINRKKIRKKSKSKT